MALGFCENRFSDARERLAIGLSKYPYAVEQHAGYPAIILVVVEDAFLDSGVAGLGPAIEPLDRSRPRGMVSRQLKPRYLARVLIEWSRVVHSGAFFTAS